MLTLAVLAALALQTAAGAPQVSPTALVDDVRRLSASDGNDQRFDVLTALLKANGLPFTVETFTLAAPPSDGKAPADPRTLGRNVVVSLGTGAEQVVVGAHYDAKMLTATSLSRGAVDNGASSVMLVHAAAALSRQTLGRRVTFVWFDFEEAGLIGSRQYLEAHPRDRIAAMLNYDINGYGDTVLFGPPSGGMDARLVRTMLETCAAESVDCIRFDGMPPGDDRSFGQQRIPTLSIAILPAAEVHQAWLVLHAKGAGLAPGFAPPIFTTIHTPADTPERLDGQAMAKALRLSTALIQRVAALRP